MSMQNVWSQDRFVETWRFACEAHHGQTLPGTDIAYINHITNVAQEVMAAIAAGETVEAPDLAVQCALLHDTVEDTDCDLASIHNRFGRAVAEGVSALTKDKSMADKRSQMIDSLERIRKQPPEVWMVKLADRITNLQRPPAYWSTEKARAYRDEAVLIHDQLSDASAFLADRLAAKIDGYAVWLS